MNRKGFITIALLITIVLFGCVSQEKTTSASKKYDVSFESFELSGNKKTTYPVISSWKLEDKCNEWNSYFQNYAKNIGDGFEENDTYEAEFEITEQTDKILSLLKKCFVMYEGAAHPQMIYETITIDMTSGKKLKLSDIADVNKVADTLLSEKGFSINLSECLIQDIWDYNFPENNPDKDTLVKALMGFDDFGLDANNVISGCSYIKDGKVVLVFPIHHVFGDYVFVKLQNN